MGVIRGHRGVGDMRVDEKRMEWKKLVERGKSGSFYGLPDNRKDRGRILFFVKKGKKWRHWEGLLIKRKSITKCGYVRG